MAPDPLTSSYHFAHQYMYTPKYQYIYNQLLAESPEDAEFYGAMWGSLFHNYLADDGGLLFVSAQGRPYQETKTRADLLIRGIRGCASEEHVILVEDKRVSMESQSDVWAVAVEQLARSMKTARAGDPSKDLSSNPHALYGIVTVGRYSRFYVLGPLALTPEEYPGTKLVEFKEDEMEIDRLLREIVGKCIQVASQLLSSKLE